VSKEIKQPESGIPQTPEQLRAFVKRTQSGDVSTLPVLRKMLQDPANIRQFGGELAEMAEMSFIQVMAGDNIGFRESIVRKLQVLREELLACGSSPVERLLAERVVACWLQVQDADMRCAQAVGTANIVQMDFHQRRMGFANRRYLSALKALAVVRKLAVPALQINVAKKQVNITTPVPVIPEAVG
jgi:hypothetical protein